ncbi:MAG: M23 family metallopeptidase [Gemmatimonadaceae bacterium]
MACALLPAAVQAQEILVVPARPEPGAIVRLIVPTSGDDSIVTIRGTLAGEPLHFGRSPQGDWSSLGPIPVDASDSVVAHIMIQRTSSAVDSLRAAVPVPTIEVVASSNLSVNTRYTSPMDAATAARVNRENARAREVGRRAHETPRMWESTFRRPRNTVITSQFGSGRVFNGELRSRHLGVDFRGAVGTEVRAANRGVVALVDTFFLAGQLIYLDHGAGITTAYFHLSKTLVAEGDTVVRGQLIGHVGESGRVTAPHLHWAARYGAINVNPLDLIARTSGESAREEQATPDEAP